MRYLTFKKIFKFMENQSKFLRRQALILIALGCRTAVLQACSGPLSALAPVKNTNPNIPIGMDYTGYKTPSQMRAATNQSNLSQPMQNLFSDPSSFIASNSHSGLGNTPLLTGRGKANDVVRSVQSQLGVKYVLGGASPSTGFDCSGLLHWAYKQNGIDIPRITTDQAYAGRSVALKNIQPGDILVFSQDSAPNKLHTGIYIGDSKFIHSPNSKSVVREESINIAYWQQSLVLARRII